ncbi:hypothetical protein [Streptomyces sp. NPDC056817]|uniref:hypothetical protein n=1 Tax=Streptomyces sp. NPDC056817 TaxID=3345950 RepID=UPI0036C6EA0E
MTADPMNYNPPTAQRMLEGYGLPEDVIDGVLAVHAQELAEMQRADAQARHDRSYSDNRVFELKGARIAADLIDPTRGERPAVPAAVLPPAPRAGEEPPAQPQRDEPVRVETLARLLCGADTTLSDGPSWGRISQTPGLGRDEYRNAARYLLRRVTITQTVNGPAAPLCGDQIPGMTCTLPDGPHDDWKHRDEEGHWWSQMRVPPYSNRERLAAEAQPASPPARPRGGV